MKRLLAILVLAGLALSARAADEALFNEDDTWNLFSTFEARFSELGQDDGVLGGIRVGGILNDRFAVGAGYYALLQEVDVGVNNYENLQEFDLWYGGLVLEYTLFAHKLVHTSVSGLIGGGEIRLDQLGSGDDRDISLFVLEPTFNLLINITQSSELGLGIGYRHADAYGSSSEGLASGDLSSAVGTLFLRLTEF